MIATTEHFEYHSPCLYVYDLNVYEYWYEVMLVVVESDYNYM